MSNKKQTAVEWLRERINIRLTYEQEVLFEGIFDQAKEMDKQQKIEAYNQGYRDGENDASNIHLSIGDIEDYSNAEQYYKETYEASH